ncbi:hypothetical protein AB0M61_44930 [Streptomyces sp. NPDC051642]|uniref:hypothetical protein n=1 Tax=Streptomyces sp. NPDC051642 TaxID=3154646 RepID=UPI00343E6FB7
MSSRNVLGVPSDNVNSTTGYAMGWSLARFLRDEAAWSFRHSRLTTVPGARSAPTGTRPTPPP